MVGSGWDQVVLQLDHLVTAASPLPTEHPYVLWGDWHSHSFIHQTLWTPPHISEPEPAMGAARTPHEFVGQGQTQGHGWALRMQCGKY